MEEVIKDGWQIIPADYKNTAYSSTGYYSSQPESYFKEQFAEDHPLVYKEQMIIRDMLKIFIPEGVEYGYYFSEVHGGDRPRDVPTEYEDWREVYHTPAPYYCKSGEYNTIDVSSTDKIVDYVYYAISVHGSSFQSALTEYVRVAK